jgi:hypothetical protein
VSRFTLIEAKPYHCGVMARRIRHAHAEAVLQVGAHVHRDMRKFFDESCYRRAWLIDGELAGVGGVTGAEIDPYGIVWLALSEAATRHTVAIVRAARAQLSEMLQTRHELSTTISDLDPASRRFAFYLGFVPKRRLDPHPYWLCTYSREDPWASTRFH